jgi:hypothetical protein
MDIPVQAVFFWGCRLICWGFKELKAIPSKNKLAVEHSRSNKRKSVDEARDRLSENRMHSQLFIKAEPYTNPGMSINIQISRRYKPTRDVSSEQLRVTDRPGSG